MMQVCVSVLLVLLMPQASVTSAVPLGRQVNPSIAEVSLLALGFLAMYVPTYVILERTIWNIVGQGHGPVMVALAAWLFWQRLPQLKALDSAPSTVLGASFFCIGLLFYVIGHSQDILMFDVGSQIPVLMGFLLLYKGRAALKLMWFPLFFILFAVPLPGAVVDALTGPLKAAVSYVAEWVLYAAGYPIGRAGVMLTIGPYQLLVADACAGLNSVFALEAIGVFYMSMVRHPQKSRNILLALLILPISFVSNVVRVIALVLVTYYFGDAVGQGFVHDFAGIVLFTVATALTIAVDSLLGFFYRGKRSSLESA